jgi:hypothetical protein
LGLFPQPNAEERSPEVEHYGLDALVSTVCCGRGCLEKTGKHTGSANETTGYGNLGLRLTDRGSRTLCCSRSFRPLHDTGISLPRNAHRPRELSARIQETTFSANIVNSEE